VVSANILISIPDVLRTRRAASLPGPGPLRKTSTAVRPKDLALRVPSSMMVVAAKGVERLAPLKPQVPAELQQITSPFMLVKET